MTKKEYKYGDYFPDGTMHLGKDVVTINDEGELVAVPKKSKVERVAPPKKSKGKVEDEQVVLLRGINNKLGFLQTVLCIYILLSVLDFILSI